MSHNLEITEKGASMAYAGEVPWYGLGVKDPSDLTAKQIMEAANLDWEVKKLPMVAMLNEQTALTTDKMALVRTKDNKILDTVSNDWNPVQNAEAFGFFHDFVMEGKMHMETAGALEDGRIVWALARIDDSFEAVPGDKVDSYLLFTNPHQYGKSVDVRFTPIRVVCNNTLTLAMKNISENSVKVSHRQEFDAEKVKETLKIAEQKLDKYEEFAQHLASKSYNQEEVKEYINTLFPITGKKDVEYSRPGKTVVEALETQPGVEFAEGSWWSAFNAVTYAIDHKIGRSDDTRLKSAWYGGNSNKKNAALKKALEMAAVGILVCHNHPSGKLQPSNSDIQLTKKIKAAGLTLDIKLLDHLIVTEKAYFSFADEGIL